MKKEELLKPKMTFEEVAVVFAANTPWMVPNYSNVGRFARKLGYTRMKQMVNRKLSYFYVKADNGNN